MLAVILANMRFAAASPPLSCEHLVMLHALMHEVEMFNVSKTVPPDLLFHPACPRTPSNSAILHRPAQHAAQKC